MATTVEDPEVQPRGQTQTATASWLRGPAREPMLAVLVGAIGVMLLIAGQAIPAEVGNDRGYSSTFALFFSFDTAQTWTALPLVALLLVAIAVLFLATRGRARPALAGLLAGIGSAGYLLAIPLMGLRLDEGAAKPALACMLLTLGSILIITAGALLYARSEDTATVRAAPRAGLGLPISVVAFVGAIVIWTATWLQIIPGQSYLDLAGAQRLFALKPLATACATASLVLFFARGRSRATLGGLLAGLGSVVAVDFLATVIFTGQGEFTAQSASITGLIGASIIAAAGLMALLTAGPDADAPGLAPIAAGGRAASGDPRARRTTRQLAAAAHLDARFASRCVREVLKERHRAVAPSFGLDIEAVLRHCVSARGRHLALAILLSGLVLPLVLALGGSGGAPLVLLLIVLAAWVATLVDVWVTRYRIVARRLATDGYETGLATRFLSPGAEWRVREVGAAESGNLVVYSGYRTHVGCGFDQGGWSFAVNITTGREDLGGQRLTPKSFTTDELDAHVNERLASLDLDGMTMSERLYVDGESVRDDTRFIASRASRPRTQLSSDELEHAGQTPEVARRYHSLNVCAWGGEIVFTTFMRFVRQGTSLYAEVTYYLLAPPREEYRLVESIDPRPPMAERLRMAWMATVNLVKLPLTSAKTMGDLPAVWAAWRRRGRDKREIARNPRFDYGARTSIRELAQAKDYRRQLQARDKDMFAKIIDREVLDAIVTFLRERDIDTSELRERGAAVLNNGVIVTGGELKGQNIAVGEKSRVNSVVERPRNAVATAGKTA